MQNWCNTKSSQIPHNSSLSIFLSSSHRFNPPWYVTNKTLHEDFKIDTVDVLVKKYNSKFLSKLQHYKITLISHLSSLTFPDNLPRRFKIRWFCDPLN